MTGKGAPLSQNSLLYVRTWTLPCFTKEFRQPCIRMNKVSLLKEELNGYSNTREVQGENYLFSAVNMISINFCFP